MRIIAEGVDFKESVNVVGIEHFCKIIAKGLGRNEKKVVNRVFVY